MSKSLSGYGLPVSLLLLKPELDLWKPSEHNGTFRGNQLAFVTGAAALDYWVENRIETEIREKEAYLSDFMQNEIRPLNERIKISGIGCIWGIDLEGLDKDDLAGRVVKRCFELGLIIETAGRKGRVVKLLPALNIEMELLEKGCAVLKRALLECL